MTDVYVISVWFPTVDFEVVAEDEDDAIDATITMLETYDFGAKCTFEARKTTADGGK
jgi:hypothetical protein